MDSNHIIFIDRDIDLFGYIGYRNKFKYANADGRAERIEMGTERIGIMNDKHMYESDDTMVSHPSHYQSTNGIECIDAIESATEDLKGVYAVDTANIIKYAWRWNKKGKQIQDVEKIIWYATHLLEQLNKAKEEYIND